MTPRSQADLGVIGVGAIAEAIVTGLCQGADAPPSIRLSPRSLRRATALAARYPSVTVTETVQAAVEESKVVLLCLRPQDARVALLDVAFNADQAVVSVMAGILMEHLRELVAPAEALARAVPLPAVARRQGLTAIHPPKERVRALFNPLGGTIAVEDEGAFDALSASTATIAAHLAYLGTISRWLMARGIPEADATRYVAAIFEGVAETYGHAPTDFQTSTREHATEGGINEQFLGSLRRGGVFETVGRSLDEVADRLLGNG